MQVMSNGRVRRTEEEWRELLARFRKSGLSAREFCRKERVQAVSLQRWQVRLNGKANRKDFITVVPATPAVSPTRGWAVEVTLPDGSRLRFQG
jgi:hypothetical protein